MASQLYNNVTDTLALFVGPGDSTITVADGSKFTDPGAGNYFPVHVILDNGSFEIMHVTSVSGNVLTVLRAQEGTNPLTFSGTESVQIRPTRQSLLEMDASAMSVDGRTLSGAISSSVSSVPTVQELTASPGEVDGQVVTVQGAQYEWDDTAQEWVNVSGWISPKAWGIQGIGDETAKLQEFCQYASDNHLKVNWGGRDKTYEFSRLDLYGDHHWVGDATLYSNKTVRDGTTFESDVAISFDNPEVAEIQVTSDINIGDTSITLASTSGIEPGDILHLESTRLIDTEDRGVWHEGEIVCVREVNGLTVELEDPISYYAKANDVVTGTVTSRVSDYILKLSNPIPGLLRDSRRRIRITTGANAGEQRFIVATNGDDVRHSGSLPGEYDRGAWPAGVVAGVGYEAIWATTAHHYKKATVNISGNMHLKRDPVTNAVSGDFSFRGMRIRGYSYSKIHLDISNFAETNLDISKDYRSYYKGRTVGANRSFDLYGGTGYGVAVGMGNRTVIHAIGARNRRTVDFSGAGGYSTHCHVEYACNAGGGLTYAGEKYFPEGDQRQTVAGSHGSGRFCTYALCEGFDTYGGMNIRGRSEQIGTYNHWGYGSQALALTYGAGLTVDSINYSDRFTESTRNPNGRQVISNNPEKRLEQIASLSFSNPFSGNLPTVINNVKGIAPSKCGIWCNSGSTTTVENVYASNWQLEVSHEGGVDDDFRFIRSGTGTTINNCSFNNINIREIDNTLGSTVLIDLANSSGNETAQFDILEGGYIKIDGTYYTRVAQGGIVRLPVRGTGSAICFDLHPVRSGPRPRALGLMLDTLSSVNQSPLSTIETPSVAVSNLYRVDILASYPGDASGTTSGNIGVNFNADAGFLTLTNNTGIAQTMAVSIR